MNVGSGRQTDRQNAAFPGYYTYIYSHVRKLEKNPGANV